MKIVRHLAVGVLVAAATGTTLADAQTYTVLYSFSGPDGATPAAGVNRDTAGNLYGTTAFGGTSNAGVVFKLDPTGKETVLHSFTGGADGAAPVASVIRDSVGNLYGTAQIGGITTGACAPAHAPAGCGVVFSLDTTGKLTVLHSFTGGADGGSPAASLIRDSAGNLYGTTSAGGITGAWCGTGCGVAFSLNTTDSETVLHRFFTGTNGGPGGTTPGGVIRDSAGNLYGTAGNGGTSNAGVVFKLDPSGKETVLYTFTGGTDGRSSGSGLIRDSAGNLYGVAGGGTSNAGVVFKLDPSGKETVLYAFTGGTDGGSPSGALIRDSAGNLYGTASHGGTSNAGVVFKLDPSGKETVLHSFTGLRDGGGPNGSLIQDTAGNLYGTTTYGGTSGPGVVFKLRP